MKPTPNKSIEQEKKSVCCGAENGGYIQEGTVKVEKGYCIKCGIPFIPQAKEEKKCVCGEQVCLGGAEVEIGGVCHRPNNPCYVCSSPTQFSSKKNIIEIGYHTSGKPLQITPSTEKNFGLGSEDISDTRMSHSSVSPSPGWEEEFDALFWLHRVPKYSKQMKDIKSFIKNLLASQQNELRSKIEGMRDKWAAAPVERETVMLVNEIANKTLDDILVLISPKE